MPVENVKDLTILLKRYEDISFANKHSIGALEPDPKKFADSLLESVSVWHDCVEQLRPLLPQVTEQMLVERSFLPLTADIADVFERLLSQLEVVKQQLGPVTFEEAHDELQKGIGSTLRDVEEVLRHAAPDYPAYKYFDALLIQTRRPLIMEQSGINKVRRLIEQSKVRPLPDENQKSQYQVRLLDKFFSPRNQVALLSATFVAVLLLQIAKLPFIEAASEMPGLKVAVGVLATLWFILRLFGLRKARKRRYALAHALTSVLLAGVVILWIRDSASVVEETLARYRDVAKLFIWWMTILWFPTQFLNAIKNHRVTGYVFYGMFWAGLAALWAYGFFRGFIIAILLLIWPISRLLSTPKNEQREFPYRLGQRLYIPATVSLVIVALVVSHEPLWLLGMTIWLVFISITRLSFKHFRRTYDLLEELFPETQGRDRKNRFLLISLVTSTALLTPGLMGRLTPDFVSSLYLQAAGLAFALITILLAVQAIIPGITTWSGDQHTSKRLREMRSILRANTGLEGFMQLFFYLFVLTIAGWLLATRFLSEMPFVVDLSLEYLVGHTTTIVDLVNPFERFAFSMENTLLGLSTLYFAAFVCLSVFAVAQLYYLFIAANTLVLPIRDALLSTPVQIEKVEGVDTRGRKSKDPKGHELVVERLQSDRKLNGYVISALKVEKISDGGGLKVAIELEMDFVEIDAMLEIVREVYRTVFSVSSVNAAKLVLFRNAHLGRTGTQNIFLLEITRHEWEFLSKSVPGFPFRYKLERLGARIIDYVAAESRIA